MPLTIRIPPLSKPGDTILLKNDAVGVPSVGLLFTLFPDIPVGAKSVDIGNNGGLDIVVTKMVGLNDAICGFEWNWEHPGGDFTTIRLRPVKPGEEIRVKDKGWEDADGNRGDLVFRFELVWPDKTEQGFREEFQSLWDKYYGDGSGDDGGE